MFGELSRKYNEHINNLVESVERVSYALFVHEPGHSGHLYIYIYIFLDSVGPSLSQDMESLNTDSR